MSDYEITRGPKFAGMMTHDCAVCGRPEVKPVFLKHRDGSVITAGSGCAGKLLGVPAHRVVKDHANIESAGRVQDQMYDERKQRAGKILDHVDATGMHPTDAAHAVGEGPGLLKTYHALKREGERFPDYLERVRQSGEI